MNTYFVRLLNYDRHTNELMLQAVNNAGNPKQAVKLMAHLLASQQIWLNRCKSLPMVGGGVWPDWEAETLSDIINQNNKDLLTFVGELKPADFENLISYKTFNGDSFQNKLIDILAHLINHGTHHRAQIGQLLKFEGIEKLPVTDYIFYLRPSII